MVAGNEQPCILTSRLRLEWISGPAIQALLAGRRVEAESILDAEIPLDWPAADDRDLLSLRLDQMRGDPAAAEWLLRAMVDRESGVMVGYANFHGPPRDGKAELGYQVFEDHRRLGYAMEAAQAMMDWAEAIHQVRHFVVSISPGNEASIALAVKLGFERTGSQVDPIDGEEWVFELRRPGRHELGSQSR